MKKYGQSGEYQLRKIAGQAMLFPIGAKSDEMQGTIALNEESECIYTMLAEPKALDEIKAEIEKQYDTQNIPLHEMLTRLMKQYVAYGVVKEYE